MPVEENEDEEGDEEEYDDDKDEVALGGRVVDGGEADGLVRVGVRSVGDHGHDGRGQPEGEDPGHHADQTGLTLRPHHASLQSNEICTIVRRCIHVSLLRQWFPTFWNRDPLKDFQNILQSNLLQYIHTLVCTYIGKYGTLSNFLHNPLFRVATHTLEIFVQHSTYVLHNILKKKRTGRQ